MIQPRRPHLVKPHPRGATVIAPEQPHGDDYDEDPGYGISSGSAGSSGMTPALTEEDESRYRKELRRREQKRKPLGFAPWKDSS